MGSGSTRRIARAAAAAAILGAIVIAVTGGARATECGERQSEVNPAFDRPVPCPTKTTKPKAAKAATTGSGAVSDRSPDGKTRYRFDDTTVTISGHVQAEFGGRIH